MNLDKNNTIIYNNYLIVLDDNSKNDVGLRNISSLFKPLNQNYTVKKFLSKKREGPENKILINEGEAKNDIELDFSINIKNLDNQKENENEDNMVLLKKNNNIDEKENNDLNEPTKKPILFDIYQKSKKGRKSHSAIYIKFMHNLIKYINSIIAKKYKGKIKLLKPLNRDILKNNNIKYNLKILQTKIKDIFLHEINGKFKINDKSYNQKVIDSIYKENITELINLFEMAFLEVFSIFRNVNETKIKGI